MNDCILHTPPPGYTPSAHQNISYHPDDHPLISTKQCRLSAAGQAESFFQARQNRVTCDYPFYQQQNSSCPRFVNIDLIASRGLGDRFLQFCIVRLVALDTDSVPVLLDMHTAVGSHGNYTGLEDFLPIGQSLPTIKDVRGKNASLFSFIPFFCLS